MGYQNRAQTIFGGHPNLNHLAHLSGIFRHLLLRLTLMTGVVLAVGLGCQSAWAQTDKGIPDAPQPQRLVNDMAGLLSPDEVATLEQKLVTFFDSTTNQVSIVTVQTLGDYEVADFAQRLGQKWGIGRKDRNNGVLILISVDERKMTIQTGFGLEAVLPDHICARIIRGVLSPAFKRKAYYQGLDEATSEVMARAKGEYNEPTPRKSKRGGKGIWTILIIFLGVLVYIIYRASKGGGGGRGGNGSFDDFSRGMGPFLLGTALGSLGGGHRSGGGFGGFGGGSGGGGFGGFGGGSFGGGGASGDW